MHIPCATKWLEQDLSVAGVLISAPTLPGPGLCRDALRWALLTSLWWEPEASHSPGPQVVVTLWGCTAAEGAWLLKGTPKF